MRKKLYFLLILLVSLNSYAIELIRLGTSYGGWTIPADLINAKSIVYSAGAGEDISFDIALIEKYGCCVYIFDPTPRAIEHIEQVKTKLLRGEKVYTNPAHVSYLLSPSLVKNIVFMPVGLWSNDSVLEFFAPQNPDHVSHSILNLQKTQNYFTAPCKRLSTLMRQLGHTHIDLLKLDIEGAEYAVIDTILQDKIDVKCICLEFDELAGVNRECNPNIYATIQKINRYIYQLRQAGYKLIYNNGYTDMTFLKDEV